MATLWMKFPDEAVFTEPFSEADKRVLENVFSQNSPSSFLDALELIGIGRTHEQMIKWHEDLPYFNWSAFISLISGGTILPAYV